MVWASHQRLITLTLMPFAPKRASRVGIIGPSVVIADRHRPGRLCGFVAGRPRRSRSTSGSGSSALKLMSAKQVLIFLIYLVPFTAFFVDGAACAAPEFLDHGCRPRRALSHQHPGADARLHRGCWSCNTARCG